MHVDEINSIKHRDTGVPCDQQSTNNSRQRNQGHRNIEKQNMTYLIFSRHATQILLSSPSLPKMSRNSCIVVAVRSAVDPRWDDNREVRSARMRTSNSEESHTGKKYLKKKKISTLSLGNEPDTTVSGSRGGSTTHRQLDSTATTTSNSDNDGKTILVGTRLGAARAALALRKIRDSGLTVSLTVISMTGINRMTLLLYRRYYQPVPSHNAVWHRYSVMATLLRRRERRCRRHFRHRSSALRQH